MAERTDTIEQGDEGERKSARVAVRLSEAAKRTLEYAAEVSGRSLSDFVVASALENAQRTIEEHDRMRLRGEDREVFLPALANPPEPSPKLRAAFERYKSRMR